MLLTRYDIKSTNDARYNHIVMLLTSDGIINARKKNIESIHIFYSLFVFVLVYV